MQTDAPASGAPAPRNRNSIHAGMRRVINEITPEIIQAHRVHLAASALSALIAVRGLPLEARGDELAEWAQVYADATLRALGITS